MRENAMTKAELRRSLAFARRQEDFLKIAIMHFRENGLGEITLTELAARSEYSKGTWYNHFKSSGSVIIALAELNATLQAQCFKEIVSDSSIDGREKLTAVFFDYVNHAILNPEIWTCGIIARIWRGDNETDSDPARDKLRQAEELTEQIVVDLVAPQGGNEYKDKLELFAALDTVRAAAAGLCILNVVRPAYTWAKSVNNKQSIGLISTALTEAGFIPAPIETRARLWTNSYARTDRISARWQI